MKMFVNFYKVDVQSVIQNESLVYAQIPLVPFNFYDYGGTTEHLISMEVDKKKLTGGYYPFNRLRDLETFKNLLQN